MLLAAALCFAVSGCGGTQPEETATVTETPKPVPEPTVEQPQMSVLNEENAPARAAYAAALKRLLDTNILPDGSGDSDHYIGSIPEREAMAENQFSVYDVDGDGREELILLYTNTFTVAAERGQVYDWDEEAGELRKQLDVFPLLTFYNNGAITVGLSHNQGKGGDFWPFTLYRYDGESDGYLKVGGVDAWDEALEIEGYPTEIDKSGTGFVYYITTDGNWTWEDPVDVTEYEAWLSPYLGEAEELAVPYAALTAENIHFLQVPG